MGRKSSEATSQNFQGLMKLILFFPQKFENVTSWSMK